MHNCLNVHIENCFVRTFDDCICVKGMDCYYDGDVEEAVHRAMYRNGKSYDVFQNVTVKNCVLWNDWGKCLEIGAETRAEEICNVTFEDCHIIHAMGRSMDCMNVDYADVHDITWRNISVELDSPFPSPQIQKNDEQRYDAARKDHTPILLGADVVYHEEYSAKGVRRGKNHGLCFEDIRVFGDKRLRFSFGGYDAEHLVSDVVIRNVYINGQPVKKTDVELTKNEFCQNIEVIYDETTQ